MYSLCNSDESNLPYEVPKSSNDANSKTTQQGDFDNTICRSSLIYVGGTGNGRTRPNSKQWTGETEGSAKANRNPAFSGGIESNRY